MSDLLVVLAVLCTAIAWLSSGICLVQALRYRARAREAAVEAEAPAYAPRATVIAPCRGLGPNFEGNVAALLRQDYPDYEVIFVTGSDDDPAHAYLTQLLAHHPGHARLTVAGPAVGRTQKVHNQLHALQLADAASEVFVFVDTDGRPGERFLRHLVAPLAGTRVGAATGYRWFAPVRRGLLDLVAASWGATIASSCADAQFSQLWGGAMAIRRERFESLGVARAWAGASTDDDALTRVMRRTRLRIAFAPRCYVLSTAVSTLPAFMAWGARQLLLMRVYLPTMWWMAFAMAAVSAYTPALGLAFTLAGALWAPNLLTWGLLLLVAGAGPAVSGAIVARGTEHLIGALGGAVPRLRWQDYLAYLPGSWLFLAHFVQSGLTRRVVWQGTTYDLLGPEHTVVVQRPGPADAPGGQGSDG